SWHGIPCIDGEVHNDLFHLARIDFHTSQRRVRAEHQGNIFADQSSQQFRHRGHRLVQVQNLWLQDLLAGEREELSSQRRGAVASLFNLPKPVSYKGVLHPDLSQEHVAVTIEDGQKVVEVMRDPTG